MCSVRVRPQSGTLYFDFRYRGTRCREQTLLKDTAANRRKMAQVLEKIEAEITLGAFNYRGYFPNSPTADYSDAMARGAAPTDAVPDFETFPLQIFESAPKVCRHSDQPSFRARGLRPLPRANVTPTKGVEKTPEPADPNRDLPAEEADCLLAPARLLGTEWNTLAALIPVAFHTRAACERHADARAPSARVLAGLDGCRGCTWRKLPLSRRSRGAVPR